MSATVIAAALGALGVLGAAGLTYLTAAQARARAEQTRTRRDLERLARENRALWYYTRHLIDWGYHPRKPGERPPEPPESIRHLYEFGEEQ